MCMGHHKVWKFLLCLCASMCMCACAHTHLHACVCVCVCIVYMCVHWCLSLLRLEVNIRNLPPPPLPPPPPFPPPPPLLYYYFLKGRLSPSLKFADSVTQTTQQDPRPDSLHFPDLGFQVQAVIAGFYMGSGDLNAGPYAGLARIEPSSQRNDSYS
jgi:hypothetical protein